MRQAHRAGLTGGMIALALAASGGAFAETPPKAATIQPGEATAFVCRGNEPFWGLDIENGLARWRTPEESGRLLDGRLTALDWSRPGLTVWRGRGAEEAGDLVAMIADEACPDSMADYDWQATARLSLADGAVVLGCCDRRTVEPDRRPDWDWGAVLPDLLPLIDACIAALAAADGAEPIAVPRAWPMNHGLGLARLRDAGFGEWDCVADMLGTTVESLEPAAWDEPPMPGTDDPTFLPGARTDARGPCERWEPALDAAGGPAGWLVYPTCR